MSEALTQNEINELLKEIDLSITIPSIIDITPAEISNIIDDETRESMERRFYIINELFVRPLHKMLNNYINSVNTKREYSFDFSSHSIKQRIFLVSKYLTMYGYTPAYLRGLLPHTVEEVNKKVEEIERQHAFQVIDSRNNQENKKIA